MSANSSSSSDVSLHPPQSFLFICIGSRDANIIFTAFTVTSVLLLLPLCITVLYLGHQRRRRRQPSASTSHSDVITYHMVVMEMIYVFSSISYCVGVYLKQQRVLIVAAHVFLITACGQMSFHVLTCVERYLAVVHPVTYMHLRQGTGVTIRNISIWCVWLLSCVELSFLAGITLDVIVILYFGQQAFSVVVSSFCSLSVLVVLKRPGPGDRDRARVDQSKQMAFYTITAIMGTLWLNFGVSLVGTALHFLPQLNNSHRCKVIESSYWFCLPSSLVLQLLFLNRAGKLPCCRSNTGSGQG